ncbi:hypothetical protein [Streptomyces sp. 900116325]
MRRSGFTGVAGVWVAGNVTDLVGKVPAVQASGVQAAAAINADLVAADTDAVVARRKEGRFVDAFSADAEAARCERALGNRRHGLGTLLRPGRPTGR